MGRTLRGPSTSLPAQTDRFGAGATRPLSYGASPLGGRRSISRIRSVSSSVNAPSISR
jgi:hypothetical protein